MTRFLRPPRMLLIVVTLGFLLLMALAIRTSAPLRAASPQVPSNTMVCAEDLNGPITGASQVHLPLVQNCPAPVTPTPTPDPWTDPEAAIEVFSPVADAVYHSPIELIGYSQTFEGSVVVRLRNEEGDVIAERPTQGGSVDGYDFFHTQLRFLVDEPQNGTVEAFEISAMDGSEIHKVTIPVILLPGQRVLDLNVPAVGQAICSPVVVSGYSNTFEANVVVDLAARSGSVLTMTTTMGGNLGYYQEFTAVLEHSEAEPQPLLVSAYGGDGLGLGALDQTRVPISFYPTCP